MSGEAGDLEGFRIRSAREFLIELEEPVAFFPALLSYPAAAILPEGSDPSARPGRATWAPVRSGSSPCEPGRRVSLERNRSYWRKGVPRSDGVVFHFGVAPGRSWRVSARAGSPWPRTSFRPTSRRCAAIPSSRRDTARRHGS